MGVAGSGGSVPVTYATWNPADKGVNITLSGGNLTLQNVVDGIARSTIGKTSGKWYWEITPSATGLDTGVASSSASLTQYLGVDANGWSFYGDAGGSKVNNNVFTAYGAPTTGGDVIGVLLDMTAGTIAFRKNGADLGVAFSGLTGAIFAAAGSSGGPNQTANFGATAFAYPVPSGYNAGLYV